jgi:hypothetical protein
MPVEKRTVLSIRNQTGSYSSSKDNPAYPDRIVTAAKTKYSFFPKDHLAAHVQLPANNMMAGPLMDRNAMEKESGAEMSVIRERTATGSLARFSLLKRKVETIQTLHVMKIKIAPGTKSPPLVSHYGIQMGALIKWKAGFS